jgi:pimeloyl-ACP methyl ester carboxylesterase
MTDLALAQLCQALYASAAPAMAAGIAYEVTDSVICCRGSQVTEDWIRDFAVLPRWTRLGVVHAGFWAGMLDLYAAVKGVTNPVIVGHSLGAAHARLLAGLFILDGKPVRDLVAFASPRPAFANLRRVIEKGGAPHRSYRFSNDPVPTVPFEIPFLPDALTWQHTEPWTKLAGTTGDENLDPLRDHAIANYVTALTPPT